MGLSSVLARHVKSDDWLDGVLVAAAGALLAGRVAFVWLNGAYFAENPTEAWQLWLGGLNYHGALLGGLMGFWLWAHFTRRPFHIYAGLLAPGLALLTAAGWVACGFDGCAYGLPAVPSPLATNLPDDLGLFAIRYRTQLFGALGSLIVFALSLWAFRRARSVVLFWGALGGLSLVRVVVALGRGDPAIMVGGWRLDLLIDLGLASICLLVLLILRLARDHGRTI